MKQIYIKYNNLSLEVKASLWFMICSMLQKGISFITVPIFTRIMTASEYGQYSVFLSWESILAIFVTFNLSYQVFNNGMVKYKNHKDAYTTSMVGLTFIIAISSFILYLIFQKRINTYMDLNSDYMYLMFLDMIFTAINGLWIVRRRYEFKYKELTIITLLTIILNPFLGIIFVTNFSDKVFARVLSIVLSNFLIFIILFTSLLRKNKKLFEIKYWNYALRINLPLIPHYLSLVLLNNSDRIMITKFCGMAYTAFYSVAYNVSMIMQIIVTSINSSFNPWIYQQLSEKKYINIRKKTKYLLVIVAFTSLIPAIFAPELLLVFGSKEYSEALKVIPPLSCCVFIMFVYTLFSNVELFYEKSNYIMIGSLGSTIINLILNYIFIKLFGYIAAAYTTLVCYCTLAYFHYLMMKKICKENNIQEEVFDIRFLTMLTVIIIILSFLIMILYKYIFIRYALVAISILILIITRNKVLNIFTDLKR